MFRRRPPASVLPPTSSSSTTLAHSSSRRGYARDERELPPRSLTKEEDEEGEEDEEDEEEENRRNETENRKEGKQRIAANFSSSRRLSQRSNLDVVGDMETCEIQLQNLSLGRRGRKRVDDPLHDDEEEEEEEEEKDEEEDLEHQNEEGEEEEEEEEEEEMDAEDDEAYGEDDGEGTDGLVRTSARAGILQERVSAKRKKKKSGVRKHITANLDLCRYPVVRDCIEAMGWKVVNEGEDFFVFWMDQSGSAERITRFANYQHINHFPGILEIARKSLLAKNLNRVRNVFPQEYNFYPRTWCCPKEFGEFRKFYDSKKTKRTFIVKPGSGSQGKGIFITRSLSDINPYESCVIQEYMKRPMLIDGFKFDLRVYVLLLSVDPLKIFLYKDGLVRLATEQYEEPSARNMNVMYMHLTNYSINKSSENYDRDEESGNKRTLSWLNGYLDSEGYDVEKLWNDIADIVIKTIIVAQPRLAQIYRTCLPDIWNDGTSCFEILGFDVILDSKCRPWLLEVNHLPSLTCDTDLDYEIKSSVLMETFELLNVRYDDRVRSMKRERAKLRKRMYRVKGQQLRSMSATEKKLDFFEKRKKMIHKQKRMQEERLVFEDKTMENFVRIYPDEHSSYFDRFLNEIARMDGCEQMLRTAEAAASASATEKIPGQRLSDPKKNSEQAKTNSKKLDSSSKSMDARVPSTKAGPPHLATSSRAVRKVQLRQFEDAVRKLREENSGVYHLAPEVHVDTLPSEAVNCIRSSTAPPPLLSMSSVDPDHVRLQRLAVNEDRYTNSLSCAAPIPPNTRNAQLNSSNSLVFPLLFPDSSASTNVEQLYQLVQPASENSTRRSSPLVNPSHPSFYPGSGDRRSSSSYARYISVDPSFLENLRDKHVRGPTSASAASSTRDSRPVVGHSSSSSILPSAPISSSNPHQYSMPHESIPRSLPRAGSWTATRVVSGTDSIRSKSSSTPGNIPLPFQSAPTNAPSSTYSTIVASAPFSQSKSLPVSRRSPMPIMQSSGDIAADNNLFSSSLTTTDSDTSGVFLSPPLQTGSPSVSYAFLPPYASTHSSTSVYPTVSTSMPVVNQSPRSTSNGIRSVNASASGMVRSSDNLLGMPSNATAALNQRARKPTPPRGVVGVQHPLYKPSSGSLLYNLGHIVNNSSVHLIAAAAAAAAATSSTSSSSSSYPLPQQSIPLSSSVHRSSSNQRPYRSSLSHPESHKS